MMIAARLAGGNLFFAFLGGGFCGALGAARSTRIFLWGDFCGGDSFFGGGGGVCFGL